METVVWVDSWQHQCCGIDFSVGSSVSWNVKQQSDPEARLAELFGRRRPRRVAFVEEHHGGATDGVLTGTVTTIDVVTCERVDEPLPHAPDRKIRAVVPFSGRLRPVLVSDRWEPVQLDQLAPGRTFEGWLIALTTARLEPQLGPPATVL